MLLLLLAWPLFAHASNKAIETLKKFGSVEGPYSDNVEIYGLSQVVGAVIEGALALLGAVFLILIILKCSCQKL